MLTTAPPTIPSPPSSTPTSYTMPPPNDPVADPSALPSQSEIELSDREQEIFNSHSDGTVKSRKDVKFLEKGVKKWMDQMELPASEETLPNLTDALKIFAAETKKKSCRGMFLFTEHGSVLVKPGKPDFHLYGTPSGSTSMKEYLYPDFTEDFTLKILQCLYPPHAISDIAKSDPSLPPYPSYDDSSDTGSIAGAELSLPDVSKIPFDDDTDSDAGVANGGEEVFPRPKVAGDPNGEVRRPQDTAGPDAITDEFEDAESFNGYAIFGLIQKNEKSLDGRDSMTQEPSSPLQAIMLQNPFLRGIIPVAPEITQQPKRPDAANEPFFEERQNEPSSQSVVEDQQSECSSMSLPSMDIPASPTSSTTPLSSLTIKRSESEQHAAALIELEQGAATIVEFNEMVKEFLDGRTIEEATGVLESARAELTAIHSNIDRKLCSPIYQEKINLLLESQSNLRALLIDAIRSDANDKARSAFLNKQILKLSGKDKEGKNRLFGVEEIQEKIDGFIAENQTEINARDFRKLNDKNNPLPVNVTNTAKEIDKRIEQEAKDVARSRSLSPSRSTKSEFPT